MLIIYIYIRIHIMECCYHQCCNQGGSPFIDLPDLPDLPDFSFNIVYKLSEWGFYIPSLPFYHLFVNE